jgi:hypothetical protein
VPVRQTGFRGFADAVFGPFKGPGPPHRSFCCCSSSWIVRWDSRWCGAGLRPTPPMDVPSVGAFFEERFPVTEIRIGLSKNVALKGDVPSSVASPAFAGCGKPKHRQTSVAAMMKRFPTSILALALKLKRIRRRLSARWRPTATGLSLARSHRTLGSPPNAGEETKRTGHIL